jgi:hypothetical protein
MAMVTAQIATIPDRVTLLKITVESLIDQVDQLNIMLNGHQQVPSFLNHPKITYHFLDNSKGDAAKFYGLKNVKGYIFTCDDDLKYPGYYVQTMAFKLLQYDNQIILTNHGRIMNPKPVSNSYTDRKAAFHCLKEETQEVFLSIGGTGAMAWHSDYFFPDVDKITKKNMADIWVAKFAHEQGCKILLNPHRAEWIQYLHPQHTIWDDHFPNPQDQTDLYNSF